MNDFITHSFFAELEKIAEAKKSKTRRYLTAAGVGTAGGLVLGAPMIRSIAKQYGARAARDLAIAAGGAGMGAGLAGGGLHGIQKKAMALPTTATFGKAVGKNHGWGSAKGGFSTSFKSAGMGSQKPGTIKPLPGTKTTGTKVRSVKPPKKPEINNMVELRRGLSNIKTG